MNPIDLVGWAFWGGIALLILAFPAFVFCAAVSLGRGKV